MPALEQVARRHADIVREIVSEMKQAGIVSSTLSVELYETPVGLPVNFSISGKKTGIHMAPLGEELRATGATYQDVGYKTAVVMVDVVQNKDIKPVWPIARVYQAVRRRVHMKRATALANMCEIHSQINAADFDIDLGGNAGAVVTTPFVILSWFRER